MRKISQDGNKHKTINMAKIKVENEMSNLDESIANVQAETLQVIEPTSERLETLKVENDNLFESLSTLKDKSEKVKVLKLIEANEKEQTLEVAAIKELERKEKENKLRLEASEKVENFLSLHDQIKGGENSEEIVKSYEVAKLEILNKFLPTFKSSIVRTSVGSGAKGGISAAIKELAKELFASGKVGGEVRQIVIKEKGYNDGTANAAILEVEKELGLK